MLQTSGLATAVSLNVNDARKRDDVGGRQICQTRLDAEGSGTCKQWETKQQKQIKQGE